MLTRAYVVLFDTCWLLFYLILSRNLDKIALFVKCEIHVQTDDKVSSSLPVKPKSEKKKYKSPSAKRCALARQQRLQEKRADEQASSLKPTVVVVTVPKEPDSVPI